MNIIAPSLLAADFADLRGELSRVENADWLHLDVMDGLFVPNISFGLPVIKSIRSATPLFFDVHLMIENPLLYINDFADAGADLIVFHEECSSPIDETIARIKKCGKKVGLSIKPNTPVEVVLPYLDKLDVLLIMSVEPGFGGQSFMKEVLPKIKKAREEIKRCEAAVTIEVDGGINGETAPLCIAAGADALVAGSYIFSAQDAKERIECLRLL